MTIYIKGTGVISPQQTFNAGNFLNPPAEYNSAMLQCIEPPVYREYINPIESRRMGRLLKMGISAAKICISEAGVTMPGAIITGTGLGLMEDTEKFLLSVIENQEKFLQPTSFIQSTHNTISGQVAIALKCTNYNSTYSHRCFSFESALLDGMLLIRENEINNALIGGFDEISPVHFKISSRLKSWKTGEVNNLQLFENRGTGTIAGEGVSFFLISNDKENAYASIEDLLTIYKPENECLEDKITNFIQKNNLGVEDIDVILTGLNADEVNDSVYGVLDKLDFGNAIITAYKHLSGEYHTSSGFALWLAANMLKQQQIPECVNLSKKPAKKIENVLIYNHFKNQEHVLMLLKRAI